MSNDDPQALTRARPVSGAVHVNHTDRFAATHVEWTGSLSCGVASRFVPLAGVPVISARAQETRGPYGPRQGK